MAISESFVIKVCFIFSVFCLSLFVAGFEDFKPKILSESEYEVNAGDNYTVVCVGNRPLTWTPPRLYDNQPEEYSEWTQVTSMDIISQSANHKFASRLFITNASFPWVGFYTCHNKHASPSDERFASHFYLYVNDKIHLSASGVEVDSVLVTQYTDAILPCRPTTPSVRVDLTLINGDKIENAVFDPKTGFKFYIDHLSYEGLYTCIFTRDDVAFETSIYLRVSQIADSVAKPLLEEVSGGHTIVGGGLTLACKVRASSHVTIQWTTPTGEPDFNRTNISQLKKHPSDAGIIYQELQINQTKLSDKGVYLCNVTDNQNHANFNSINVTIFDVGEHYITLTEENDVYQLSETAGADSVQWRIDVHGHPEPKLLWLNNYNETIPMGVSAKYVTSYTSTETILKIKDIAITDFGNYTLVAENQYGVKSLMLFLNVTDKPSVHIESDNFHLIDVPSMVKCIVAAYPKPKVSWFFKPCQEDSCFFQPKNESFSEQNGLQVVSYLNITASKSGFIKCSANNSLGDDEAIQGFFVSDVEDGLDIFGFDDTVVLNEKTEKAIIAIGEKLTMVCGASVHNYTDTINWLYNGKRLQADDRYTLEKSHTMFTHRLTLIIPQITYTDGGSYSCQVSDKNGLVDYKDISIVVAEPSRPMINDTNLVKDIEMKLPKHLELFCSVWGIPKPSVTWFKNNEIVEATSRIKMVQDNQRLIFIYTEAKDEGAYKCLVTNKMGSDSRQVNLRFKNKPEQFNRWFILVIAVLLLIVILAVVYICIKIRNEKKLQRELKIAGLANFEKGALENLNPELGIDEQAELLPYDKKWEFPIEKLKLGKQLGSGAFGVVMKGEARGIVDDENATIVAVKMVKRNADHTYIKALASELKVMVHLGKHLNVVNLLGACTKNVAKRELLVIVEYCRFGNVQNYLLRHRDNFVDQVDPKTGHIDYNIGLEILERTYSVSSNRSNPQSPYLKYAALTFSNSNGGQVQNNMGDYRSDNYCGTTARTDTTTVSMSPNSVEEGTVVSNNSVQPEWRSNYRGDYKGNVKPICTKDLLAWAFQVSRGMEYLASRKVLHGDLAARNILLADNNVVKICDFGLAKSMYKNDNYKKKGDGPLPVKWMAIESIRDRVFSTQSDVWSFGIVLWEFFSLGRTPYPGMEADERLYSKLLDGYRMESPQYSPKEVYKMMLDCWQAKPLQRPSFTKLAERIGSMLEDSVRKNYIDLNDPYLVMNTQRIEQGYSDYLAMLNPPNFENLSSPHHYINDLPQSEDSAGYLCMKPTTIFSPRVEDERIFDFDGKVVSPKQGGQSSHELVPMLGGGSINSESDCDSACNSPVAANSFSNPSYHLPPNVDPNRINSDKHIVKSMDNYVNMPQNKNIIGKEKHNNPFTKETKDYVNSNSRDWESIKV